MEKILVKKQQLKSVLQLVNSELNDIDSNKTGKQNKFEFTMGIDSLSLLFCNTLFDFNLFLEKGTGLKEVFYKIDNLDIKNLLGKEQLMEKGQYKGDFLIEIQIQEKNIVFVVDQTKEVIYSMKKKEVGNNRIREVADEDIFYNKSLRLFNISGKQAKEIAKFTKNFTEKYDFYDMYNYVIFTKNKVLAYCGNRTIKIGNLDLDMEEGQKIEIETNILQKIARLKDLHYIEVYMNEETKEQFIRFYCEYVNMLCNTGLFGTILETARPTSAVLRPIEEVYKKTDENNKVEIELDIQETKEAIDFIKNNSQHNYQEVIYFNLQNKTSFYKDYNNVEATFNLQKISGGETLQYYFWLKMAYLKQIIELLDKEQKTFTLYLDGNDMDNQLVRVKQKNSNCEFVIVKQSYKIEKEEEQEKNTIQKAS